MAKKGKGDDVLELGLGGWTIRLAAVYSVRGYLLDSMYVPTGLSVLPALDTDTELWT